MKKRIYRAVRVQQINGTQLSAMVQDKRVAIGVDIAKEDQYAAVMVEGGTVLVTMKWKHPMETAEVVELFKALPASEVGCERPLKTVGNGLEPSREVHGSSASGIS